MTALFGLALLVASAPPGAPSRPVPTRQVPPTAPPAPARGRAAASPPAKLTLYGLRYGSSLYPWKKISSVPGPKAQVAFAWMFYLVVTPARRILIDTGLVARRHRKAFGIRGYRHPAALLKRLGVAPGQITDVVLTHHHVDHAGGAYLYPNAVVHLRRATYRRLMRGAASSRVRRWLRRATRRKRVRILRGRHRLLPRLTLVPTGGHAVGHQIVELRGSGKSYVLTGDECYLRRLCRRGVPLPRSTAAAPLRNRRFMRRLGQRHRQGDLVLLPFHDPAILTSHPRAHADIARILTVR